jgi:tetratricopeptide (TPR) repeat protein
MSRLQYLIIFSAIVAVILLFSLPKIIVNNDRKLQTEQKQEHTDGPAQDLHKVQMTDNDRLAINNLTKTYNNLSDNEKKVKFADSLANYYHRFHQYDSSGKYFEEEARLAPTSSNFVKTGDAYYEAFSFNPEQGKAEELTQKARQYYQKVLDKEPGNLAVKNKVASTYIGTDKVMEAVLILKDIVKADPHNKEALYNLGILSIQSGQFDKAIGRFEEIISFDPADANAHFYLGMSYMNKGEKKKAKDYFDKAKSLEKDPAFQATVDDYIKELK